MLNKRLDRYYTCVSTAALVTWGMPFILDQNRSIVNASGGVRRTYVSCGFRATRRKTLGSCVGKVKTNGIFVRVLPAQAHELSTESKTDVCGAMSVRLFFFTFVFCYEFCQWFIAMTDNSQCLLFFGNLSLAAVIREFIYCIVVAVKWQRKQCKPTRRRFFPPVSPIHNSPVAGGWWPYKLFTWHSPFIITMID